MVNEYLKKIYPDLCLIFKIDPIEMPNISLKNQRINYLPLKMLELKNQPAKSIIFSLKYAVFLAKMYSEDFYCWFVLLSFWHGAKFFHQFFFKYSTSKQVVVVRKVSLANNSERLHDKNESQTTTKETPSHCQSVIIIEQG